MAGTAIDRNVEFCEDSQNVSIKYGYSIRYVNQSVNDFFIHFSTVPCYNK